MTVSSTHASFTGTIPENYDTYLGPLLFEFTGADLAGRLNKALNGSPAKVLEVACGTGISTRHLAELLPANTTILATDLNDAMLAHAQKVNAGLSGVSYSQADALDLPFDDETFDAVVCPFGVMFFPDKALGMSEMTRVLKPGGVMALNVWDSFAHNQVVEIVDRIIKQFFNSDPPRFLETPFGMSDISEGRNLFRDAGFDSVEVDHVRQIVTIEDHHKLARGFITGNPTVIEVEQRASVSVEEIIAAAEETLDRELGRPPTDLSFQAIVYLAHKPSAP